MSLCQSQNNQLGKTRVSGRSLLKICRLSFVACRLKWDSRSSRLEKTTSEKILKFCFPLSDGFFYFEAFSPMMIHIINHVLLELPCKKIPRNFDYVFDLENYIHFYQAFEIRNGMKSPDSESRRVTPTERRPKIAK